MSEAEAIGVDLGGTKMLLGVLDGDSKTVWESRERSAGEAEDELVELLVREVEEARAERAGVEAIGMGIPATIDHEKGLASPRSTCRSRTCRSATSSASAPACRSSSTTTPTSPPSPSTSSAPPAAPTTR